jgi:hypothetical protein
MEELNQLDSKIDDLLKDVKDRINILENESNPKQHKKLPPSTTFKYESQHYIVDQNQRDHYLIRFRSQLEQYRVPEVESILQLYGINGFQFCHV